MKFINRQKEMSRLDRLAELSESALAVIWGRRRIGKTRLLLEWAHKHNGVYFTADESASSVQRKYFSLAIEKALPGFSDVEYADWSSLLTRLARDASHNGWRGPIVIDELPYLISASPELPSILQRFIDQEAKKANLIIALCGSSQRMMQGAVLDANAPLYGRAQEIIKLRPISVSYIGEALRIKEPREIIKSYAIWGGIPRYWELVANSGKGFFDSIDQLVLDPMGPLNDEPQRLLLEESPPATILRPILDAIGLGANRISEIASRIGQPVTSLTRHIQRLIELDLIEREVPFGSHEHQSKKALYKIKDPFLRFWFEIVAPQRSFLAQSLSSSRHKMLKENLPPLFAITWEELSRLTVPFLSQYWKEDEFTFGEAGRYWHGKGPEWDIVAESQNNKFLFVGEAKWIEKTPTESWIHKTIDGMIKKGFPPISRDPKAQTYYCLFIPEKPKHLKLPPKIKVIDAEEVIRLMQWQ